MPAVHNTEVRDSIDRAMAYEAAEREKFERWTKANTPLKLDRDLASYFSGTTQFAWMAWIERAVEADPRVPYVPAQVVEVPGTTVPTLSCGVPAFDAVAELREIRNSLQFANDSPSGGISDTIWMIEGPETVFDALDRVIEGMTTAGVALPDGAQR